MDKETLKREANSAIDAMRDRLLKVSHDIHAHPELAFEEAYAADRLTKELDHEHLPVTRSAFGVDTAYASEFGDKGATVAILSEYDALPGIGHDCGHNIIAAAGLGAALALSKLKGKLPGKIRYLGTPAEERYGGKEYMARKGAFDGADAAMMVHPCGVDLVTMPCIAVSEADCIYHGVAAHASAMPYRGVNALDALITAYQSIAQLRQHIRQSERIHGIITEGGLAPNIVPERAAGRFYVRAANAKDLAALKVRVAACFEAGAKSSGARLELEWSQVDYLDLKTNWSIARAYRTNAEGIGRKFTDLETLPPGFTGSTDMGNVSHRVPSIHPMIAASPPNIVIHNAEFAHWAGSPMGDQATIDGAKCLAMTAIDVLCDSGLREAAKAEFIESAAESKAAVTAAYREEGIHAGGCGCC